MIKIIPKNYDKIKAAIDMAEGRATQRTISVDGLLDSIKDTEQFLSRILFKKDWVGLRFVLRSFSGKLPTSYSWSAKETKIIIERKKTGWYFVYSGRGTIAERIGTIDCINLHTKKEEIVEKLTRFAIDA